ncbi:MAG: arylsulfatase [Gemmataceae bacterium]|nr:arylsulfatase [Gemmataceae bacterium]
MTRRLFLASLILVMPLQLFADGTKPNVVLIYADDIGYGDVSCYGAKRVTTPHIDRIAAEGIRFTDGHCSSGTCTPSRFSMLTGEYAFRKSGTGVLPGNAPLIIPPTTHTLAKVFQIAGYTTGVVGKWHLGLGGPNGPDWNGLIQPGPAEVGFKESFIIPATGDRVPCVYVENGRVAGLDSKDPIEVSFKKKVGNEPTGKENPELLRMRWHHGHDMTIVKGISRIGWMTGGKAALWDDETMADTLAQKATRFIENHKKDPFFLYFGLHDIHVPRVPNPRFVGKSGMGPRGDCILQADFCVGEILKTLEKHDLTKNTIVIFTSDNGPVINDGYYDDAVVKLGDHKPAGPLRGGKYSNFEGGTRIPFLLRWPAMIKPSVSNALVCQVDFLSSFASLLGQTLKEGDSPDSLNTLPALLGHDPKGREFLIEHANRLSLRQGTWKYIEPGKGPKRAQGTDTELGQDPAGMLFDLSQDLGETNNLIATLPERGMAMAAKLLELRSNKSQRKP